MGGVAALLYSGLICPMNHNIEVSIRPFRIEYQEEVIHVIGDCYQDLGWELDLQEKDRDLTAITHYYQNSLGDFWTLWIDNKIEGTIALQKHEGFYLLRRFYIRSEWRGRGMGKLMLQHLFHCAREAGIKLIRLSTKERHSAAYHLFEKLGFSETTPGDYSLRCDIFMQKSL